MRYFVQSPILNKDESTINDSIYYESDKQIDTISYSKKMVDPRNDPKTETHIVGIIRKLSVGLFEPAVIRVIRKDLITNVQKNSCLKLSMNSLSPLDTDTSKSIVIGSA